MTEIGVHNKVHIVEGTKDQAAEIARLIMTAMTDDCCLYFCGDGFGLNDFHKMMTMLVERENSQYSYRNTLVAMDGDKVIGISVSYDGARLHELRRAFIEAAKKYIGKAKMIAPIRPKSRACSGSLTTSMNLMFCMMLSPIPQRSMMAARV